MVLSIDLSSHVNFRRLSTKFLRKKCVIMLVISLILLLYILDNYEYFSVPSISHYNSTLQAEIKNTEFRPLPAVNSFQSIENAQSAATISTTMLFEKLNELEYRIPKNKTFHRNVFIEIKDIKRKSTNIFFVETRCAPEKGYEENKNSKGFLLNARHCCAVESTALANLDRNIYIFHSCPVSDNFFEYSPKFVEKLFSYPNVYLVRLNISEIFKDTPVEELYEKRLLDSSKYPVHHASDIIRLILIWRFGGIYCDLDIVTIRSFAPLKSNWAGAQDPDTINSGVLSFEPDGSGHEMVQQALDHLNEHFDGDNWANNGPLLLTRIILKHCNASSVFQSVRECSGNFTVWDVATHYPIDFNIWNTLFRDDTGEKVVTNLKSKSFTVHTWNKLSEKRVLSVGSTCAYALLAKEFCPEVYENCGKTF